MRVPFGNYSGFHSLIGEKGPVHEVRVGRVRAVIWENETPNGKRHNVTISRLYKDGDQWKDSTSFGRDDLPLVAKVTDLAHSWIFGITRRQSRRIVRDRQTTVTPKNMLL